MNVDTSSFAMAPPLHMKPATTSSNLKRGLQQSKSTDCLDKVPNFLRKTYNIVETCDPSIVTWSEDGLSFDIKDTDRLASEVLGRFFKHNNFSSFVRQLNFYGFRKIKSDQVIGEGVVFSLWKFKHEKFQRGRPELLSEMRKSNPTELADKSEIEILKTEANEMKGTIKSMHFQLSQLNALVAQLLKNNPIPTVVYPERAAIDTTLPPTYKRRKVIPGLTIASASSSNDTGASFLKSPVESKMCLDPVSTNPFMSSSSVSSSSSTSSSSDHYSPPLPFDAPSTSLEYSVADVDSFSAQLSPPAESYAILSSEEEYMLSDFYLEDGYNSETFDHASEYCI